MNTKEAWLCYNRDGNPNLHMPARAEYYTLGAAAYCVNCGARVLKVSAATESGSAWVRRLKVVEWP